MQLPLALNLVAGSALVVVLIFADYIRKYDIDRTQKTIFCSILVFVFILMMSAITTHLAGKKPVGFLYLTAGFLPAVFAVYKLAASRDIFRTAHFSTLLLLIVFAAAGFCADALLGSIKLVWPCMTAALLYCYFFIIRTGTKIDSLTGIGNRYCFTEFTDRLSRHKSGESWAIVMIDMDHFKKINDTLGHQEGDNALRDMAAIIKSCIRHSDFAARYGGDEFVLATKSDGIASLMDRIQAAVDRQNEQHVRPFKIEISYGYDVYTADGTNQIEAFLNHIDGLMYKHKEERRRAGDFRRAAL